MASTTTNTPQEQASAVSAFAGDLQRQLSMTTAPSGTLVLTDDTLRTLDRHLDQLPLSRMSLSISARRQLDLKGTGFWNTCAQLMATCREDAERTLLSKAKSLAFGMLESVAPRQGSGNLRALELALKTARDCLECGQLELGLKILEAAAARLDTFEKSGFNTDKSKLSTITTEYYMLRIYLSWLQGRPDIADHLFSKITKPQDSQSQQNMSMEICYAIGASALSQNQSGMAVVWLERALESSLCPNQNSEQPKLALKDMRLLTLHAFVRAHLPLKTKNSRGYILQALNSLKTEYKGIFPVVMLQLHVLGREEQPNYKEYFECLETAVRMMDPSEENLKVAFYHILKLKMWSWEHSIQIFQQLLFEKLAPSDCQPQREQYFVTFIWMITSHGALHDLDIIGIARKVTEYGCDPLSEEATHASLVLIWKNIEGASSIDDVSMAERWCFFVLEQPIFQNCSIANRGILQRKLMICALDNPNTSLTHGMLSQILEQNKGTPSTLYLVFRIALLHDKYDLGTALEALSKLGTTGTTYLLSCVAEAQRLGKTRPVINSLLQFIAALDCAGERELYTTAVFQSTICTMSTELDNCKANDSELLERLCNVFEVALKEVNRHELSAESSIFPTNEIEWLFHKSYDLALQLIKTSHHGPILRLIDISTKLADSYNRAPVLKDESELSHHYLSCKFLKAITLVTEARVKTNPLEKKNYYHEIRNAIQHFRDQLQNHNETNPLARWQKNYRALLSFDFEAATLLSEWDSLPSIIEECHEFEDGKLCALFLDSILASAAPVDVMARVVMTMINTLHTSPSPSLNEYSFHTTLPRYLRCLFQLSLQANETPLAEAILDKALSQAHEGVRNNNPNGKQQQQQPCHYYPNEELEWLATVAFNRATDFYLASADEVCRRWADKAIEVADLVGLRCDNNKQGALGRLLRMNLAKLF